MSMYAKTEFSVTGPIFKLALEHGERPAICKGMKEQAKPKITMAEVASLVESGKFKWCAYMPEYYNREMNEWRVAASSDLYEEHVKFFAPAAEKISLMRAKNLEDAALAKAHKAAGKAKAGKTTAKVVKAPVSATLVRALLDAIERDDLKEIAKLAPAAANGLSAKRHPLVEAALAGKPDVLKILLPHADPDAMGLCEYSYGSMWPALAAAAFGGDVDCVKLLLKAGADVNIKEVDGESALCVAASKGHAKAVAALLAHPDTDPNEINSKGNPALCLAVDKGHSDVVNVFLGCPQIDANLPGKNSLTPLCRATGDKNGSIVKALLNWPGIDATAASDDGRTPLIWAAICSDHDAVASLLPLSDANTRDNNGLTALMAALKEFGQATSNRDWDRIRESMACLDALLPATDCKSVDKDGRNILAWALSLELSGSKFGDKYEFDDVFDMLLAKVDPNQADRLGDTPLTLMAEHSFNRVATLLNAGADPNQANIAGDTPLIISARDGDLNSVRLLAPVSNANAKGAAGRTALMECVAGLENGSSSREFNRLLCALRLMPLTDLNKQDDLGNTALMLAVPGAPLELLEALLAGSNPNAQNNKGETALLIAITERNQDFFKALLPVSDFDIRDSHGCTPLMRAASTRSESLEQLLSRGADASAVDHDGHTALHWAVSNYSSNSKNVSLLLPLSDVLAKTVLGKTALDLARENVLEEAINLIEPMDSALREREAIKPPLKKKTPPKASNSTQPPKTPLPPKKSALGKPGGPL